MFLDNSACNLASFNLLKFVTPGGQFDIAAYRHAVSVMITAMEILVDNSGYPTETIARNSHDYRPLGLGYANLGALLMWLGLPYDSDAGRDFAACLTAIMCGQAYLQSSVIASSCPPLRAATPLTQQADRTGGACPGFYVNREPFLDVVRMHRASVNGIGKSRTSSEPFVTPQLDELIAASTDAWDNALSYGERYGYRNSQVTVLAPTGTIGFMMDCDTTGIEPDLALVKYKKLVGGGMIKIVNNTVPSALFKLGYSDDQVNSIVSYIDSTGTIEGAPGIKPEHLAVFDCSFKPAKGTRSIHYMGHIKMMAATQPFLSGAISKTVNLPNDATVEDIAEAYIESWRQGLKAVAIYRDGSKGVQPLNVSKDAKNTKGELPVAAVAETPTVVAVPVVAPVAAAPAPTAYEQDKTAPPRAIRHRLPEERASVTHKFAIAGHEGYITVGLYPNGQPGEIFIRMAKEGSTVSGLMDAFATAVSLSLQHGVPLKVLCEKFAHTRFEPSGWTGNEQLGYAKSIMDYIFRWLQLRFLSGQQLDLFKGMVPTSAALPEAAGSSSTAPAAEGGFSFRAAAEAAHAAASGTAGMTSKGLGGMGTTNAPSGGIAPTPDVTSGGVSALGSSYDTSQWKIEDRGIYHASDAMRSMYDMGDAPSCQTCGAIMVRNGSCYRCMSCGSTSGCS